MQIDEQGAIDDEIALLKSMYPDDVTYEPKASTLKFKPADGSGSLELRLPSGYPTSALPEVIEARGRIKNDLRSEAQTMTKRQQRGEPCLDAILIDFIELLQRCETEMADKDPRDTRPENREQSYRTIIVWLHHLLATGKRKQALSADCANASQIRGITKPGYPGVLIFSGPASPVEAHVQTLKHLRWQAFQIRYEGDELWSFKHGLGIVEVETMADVVTEVEVVPQQKELLLEALKIK